MPIPTIVLTLPHGETAENAELLPRLGAASDSGKPKLLIEFVKMAPEVPLNTSLISCWYIHLRKAS
jgi:hypothetical protein